jgi:hypothetical protein
MKGIPGLTLDWVDGSVPAGADVGIVPFPVGDAWGQSAPRWWDTEFWNGTVRQAFADRRGTFSYTPFSTQSLEPAFASGRIAPLRKEPDYLVVADAESRFGIAGVRHGASYELEIMLPEHPYRAAWMTRGLDVDGWTRPGRRATVRVYGDGRAQRQVALGVGLSAPATATAPVAYALGAQRGRIDPGQTTTVQLDLCVPARGHVDTSLLAGRGARVDGPPLDPQPNPAARVVGVKVGAVGLTETGRGCRR